MILKLTVITCSLALTTAVTYGPIRGQVSPKYPAGIDPNTCPNFPYCANPLVAVSQGFQQPQEYQAIPLPPAAPPRQAAPLHQAASPYRASQPYQTTSLRQAALPLQVGSPHQVASPHEIAPPRQLTPQYRQYRVQQIAAQYQPKFTAAPKYQPQPQAQQYHQYQVVEPQAYGTSYGSEYTPEQQRALDRGEYIGDGDYHGEGLAEALTPGFGGYEE